MMPVSPGRARRSLPSSSIITSRNSPCAMRPKPEADLFRLRKHGPARSDVEYRIEFPAARMGIERVEQGHGHGIPDNRHRVHAFFLDDVPHLFPHEVAMR